MSLPWWHEGIRFECQQSGKCCVSHGEYGHVYLTREDRRRLAAHFGLTVRLYLRRDAVREDGYVKLREEPGATACRYLDGVRCGVYEARPTQCRTWPFWPDLMSAKAWTAEVASFCPGVGKGPIVPAGEIRARLREQREADEE